VGFCDQDNEEAIESGAFWFYRKLGFGELRRLWRLLSKEEERIEAQPGHRMPETTLRKLAPRDLCTGRCDYGEYGSNFEPVTTARPFTKR
jgi:hypothetical protein